MTPGLYKAVRGSGGYPKLIQGEIILKKYGLTDITADEYAKISVVTILDDAMADFSYLADALKKDDTPEDFIQAVFDRIKVVRNKEAVEAGIEVKA